MLSYTFLVKIARIYQLTPEQEEIFLLKFGEHKRYEEIARQLNISKEACLKRMGGIYEKFGLQGNRRGKEHRLRVLLNQKYQLEKQENQYHKLIGDKQVSIIPVKKDYSEVIKVESSDLVWEPKDRINNKITALNVDKQNQKIINPSSAASSKLTLDNPDQWIKQLREKLNEGKGINHVQQVLKDFCFQLPEVVELVAATSKRTELEITKDLLDKIASII